MSGGCFKPLLQAAMAVAVTAAWAGTADAGDRIYKWIDKSGQENYTDDINNVPEPYKAKFKKEDEQRKSKNTQPIQQPSTNQNAQTPPTNQMPSSLYVPAAPNSSRPASGSDTSGKSGKKAKQSDDARNDPNKTMSQAEYESYKSKGSKPQSDQPKTDSLPPSFPPPDPDKPQSYKKAEYQQKIARLKEQLAQKNEEYEYAVKWEMMVRTPKYTQDKLRLMDEMKEIQEKISDYETKLNDLDKPKPE